MIYTTQQPKNTNLHGANLISANLISANPTAVNAHGATLPATYVIYHAARWAAHITLTHICIGCQRHPVEEWANFPDNYIDSMHPDALQY